MLRPIKQLLGVLAISACLISTTSSLASAKTVAGPGEGVIYVRIN